jgi:hypothetical protein
VSSLIPRPESHDEDGRDSIERDVAERVGRWVSTIIVISCYARLQNLLLLDLRRQCGSMGRKRGEARWMLMTK